MSKEEVKQEGDFKIKKKPKKLVDKNETIKVDLSKKEEVETKKEEVKAEEVEQPVVEEVKPEQKEEVKEEQVITLIEEIKAEDKKDFCITHFLNPVRYMVLLEIFRDKLNDQNKINYLKNLI